MSDKTYHAPPTPEQQRIIDSVAAKRPDIANAGALYHHISWTTKLLGQDLNELPDGDYVLAFSVRKRGENVYVDRWSLEGVEPDGATGGEEA